MLIGSHTHTQTEKHTCSSTHTKAHGNELAERVTQKNNANLCSSRRGSTGNNKDRCFLRGKSELGIMFGVSRDPAAVIKATLKLIYYIKRSEKTSTKQLV